MSIQPAWTTQRAILALATFNGVPNNVRVAAYRAVGIGVGSNTVLCARHRFGVSSRPHSIIIGSHCYVNEYCWFDTGDATISLGDHVVVAADVRFQAITHTTGSSARRAVGAESFPILIGDGSWIGTGAIVMPGVSVAQGCIVGAGAVVTKSTEPNGLYVGVPAKRIRDLPE